jgi:hypothetical protein
MTESNISYGLELTDMYQNEIHPTSFNVDPWYRFLLICQVDSKMKPADDEAQLPYCYVGSLCANNVNKSFSRYIFEFIN